jgi:uncharacterized protein
LRTGQQRANNGRTATPGSALQFAPLLPLLAANASTVNPKQQHETGYGKLPLIAFLTLELHIEAAQSLKDKRQVVRSLKDRLRASFNVSVAELDAVGLWNRATIGVVSISGSRDYLDGLMKNVERQATRIANNHGAEVADSFVEYL